MSTITKQWLQQKIAEMEEHRDLFPGDLDDDHANVLSAFRIALASLEADPVGFIVRNKKTGRFGSWMHSKADWFNDDGYEVLSAYIAPPVPVSVPDAIPKLKDGQRFKYVKDGIRYSANYANGWNACRAAMLQGADGNYPDGWVACSERMPEDNAEQEVLACFKGGDISTLYYFEGRWDDVYGIVPIRQDVTHWMPLPAPPQK